MPSLPNDNSDYLRKEYWEQRYELEKDSTFDWFKGWSFFADVIQKYIKKSDRILMLGCGNSRFSEDMYDAGYNHIFNVDYCGNVIETMKNRNRDRPMMEWQTMDVMDMRDLADGSFDVAIDKGTMDALMCEKGDVWDPPQSLIDNVYKEVKEVSRVLNPTTGRFIYITFGQPHFRRLHLERDEFNWDLAIEKAGDAFHYFVYIMHKKGG